jgi:CRP/FNR family transcriptional regulator
MMDKVKSTPCELCLSRNLSLFAGLGEVHLCNISEGKNFISHKKGQILYYENTKPLGVFCVNSGVVKIFKTASNGKDQIIKLGQKGDLVGYSSLIGEEAYTTTAAIVEDAGICFVPKEVFLKVMKEDNNFHQRLTQALCHDMGLMESKLTDATQKSIRERLALTLLKLGDSYGVDGGDRQRLDIALTREEIAGLVGTATETVIRLLSEFKKDKLIDLQGKKIILLNRKGLARLSDFYG